MVAIPRLTVRTEYGSVMAVPHRGSLLFRNVPYAAAPFANRRFLPAARPAVWDGLRDGAEPGVGMPQPNYPDPLSRYFNPKRQGEDALTLEVQTPEIGRVGMPVMVWIHGGGFMTGAGSAQANDGFAFARDGIVHVSLNYRLGIDGWLLFDDHEDGHTDNLGLRDMIFALEWVQRNIAFFGGDPDNVTIAGHSTGGSGVAYLLAAPSARGLFHRAISQSGSATMTMPVEEARVISARVSELAGRPATRAGLRELSHDESSAIVQQVFFEVYGDPARWEGLNRIPVTFCGVHGTDAIPRAVIPALANGSASGVAILAGTTKDETSNLFEMQFPGAQLDSDLGRQLLRGLNAGAADVEAYREAVPACSTDLHVIAAIATDRWARRPTLDMLSAHDDVSFLYQFTWESPMLGEGTGAIQGLDIPFANDDFENMQEVPRGARMLGNAPSPELAVSMHTAFADFVKVGDPGWPAWDSETSHEMRFDHVGLEDPAVRVR
jgi:carboxylesterase type B